MKTRNLSPKLKHKIWLALVLAWGVTLPAGAQPTNMPALYYPTLLVYTNFIPDNTNYAVPAGPINSIYYSEIGVYCAYQRSGDGTNGVAFPFSGSLHGTNTSPLFTAYLPANGTNLVWTNFTVNLQALGYFHFDGPNVASNNNSVSNLQIYLTPKPSRRDKF